MVENWLRPGGTVIACTEKIKVLDENYAELQAMAQDALDDAVLIGGSEENFKKSIIAMIMNLKSAYPEIDGSCSI